MAVGQCALLVLRNTDHNGRLAECMVFFNEVDEHQHLHAVHAAHEIGPILPALPGQQFALDLRPVGIRCHGDEKIGFAFELDELHGVVVPRTKVSGAPNHGLRADDSLAADL